MAAKKKKTSQTVDLSKLVDLSPAQVAKLPKPRDGFDAHVDGMLAFYDAHKDALGTVMTGVAEVRARLGAWQSLAAVEASAAKHLEMTQETRLLHSSVVWSALLDIYGRGQQAAKRDPAIAAGIAEFEKFMKLGPRKKPA
ncbi:MAG: hypothetical protein HY904_25115 [Deltaproteobacteria bacterium]|nr:hypothetical protein [Deltaproteobacteria bacterium]